MKSCLLASISTLALVGAAAAADMPVAPIGKAPIAPVMAPSWTGPYVGLNAGAIRTRTHLRVDDNIGLDLDPTRFSTTGATLGGQIGYNWQQNNFVYGVEADLNWTRARASKTIVGAFGDDVDLSSRMNWFGTLRARAGFTNSPTLYYLTGGVAFAGIRNSAVEDTFGTFNLRTSGTRTGWVVGGGIEHMFTHNMSVKAEVLYMDFGRKSASFTNSFGASYTGRFKNTAVVGRLGVNVKW